jgi:hypothetical protein
MTITREQARKLQRYAQTCTLAVAAAKAGMSENTARKYLRQGGQVPPQTRDWRTRTDPFAEVWEEITSLLKADPGLQAKTILEWLIELHPTEFSDAHLRTLQRRVRDWRAMDGPDKEVFFPQDILPGRQSQSDYTNCNELGVTICGAPFPHLLFHFILPYSRWETAFIAYTESFESLTDGYAKSVHELGAVAPEHRTDNLAAAVPIGKHPEFQERWKDFLSYYKVKPSANNPGESHENGAVEKSHHLFKNALDQRLRLRGSRDFASIEAYEEFFRDLLKRRNKERKKRLDEELRLMPEVPTRSWKDPKELWVTVTPWSTIIVLRSTYSVPSRLIGIKLRVLAFRESIEVYYGNKLVQEMPRIKPGESSINYRHIILHLVRKPRAFENYRFREGLFPSATFRKAFDALGGQKQPKQYLRLLQLAALNSESEVESAIRVLLLADQQPTPEHVEKLLVKTKSVPDVVVAQADLHKYDRLMPSHQEIPA